MDDTRTSNTHIARARAEKAHDSTLDDEKWNWPRRRAVRIDRTCVVVTAICNQPEAFASDLGNDQLRYLFHWWRQKSIYLK